MSARLHLRRLGQRIQRIRLELSRGFHGDRLKRARGAQPGELSASRANQGLIEIGALHLLEQADDDLPGGQHRVANERAGLCTSLRNELALERVALALHLLAR